jgi:hypothetical protein
MLSYRVLLKRDIVRIFNILMLKKCRKFEVEGPEVCLIGRSRNRLETAAVKMNLAVSAELVS